MSRFCLCLLLFASVQVFVSQAQPVHHTVSGFVFEGESGEPLLGATVVDAHSGRGTATDRYGRFGLIVAADTALLQVSYLGYLPQRLPLVLRSDTLLRIGLQAATFKLEDLAVTAVRPKGALTAMSQHRLTPQEIEQVPALAGEPDLVKALQLMPGVQGGREGAAGLYVRGGGPDQNLVLLDGTPIYNANHLLGFVSTFNPDVIRSVTLAKGAGSAQYGGRLSSVLDVALKEGDRYERHTRGAVGLVASRLTTEGPLQRGRAAYLFSVRRTYLDALWGLGKPAHERDGYYFYDLVGKLSVVGRHQGLYLSLYGGRDRFYSRNRETWSTSTWQSRGSLAWGNLTGTLRWQGQLSPRVFASASVGRTAHLLLYEEEHLMQLSDRRGGTRSLTNYRSGVADWTLKVDVDLQVGHSQRLSLGGVAVAHTFTPSSAKITHWAGEGTTERRLGAGERVVAQEYAAYAEHETQWGRRWHVASGLRATAFAAEGATYASLEPRLATRYSVNERMTVEAAYGRARQYVHLVSPSSIGVPLDLWLPTTDQIRPQEARQVSLGATYSMSRPGLEMSAEIYLKQMDQLIMPIEGASLLGIDTTGWEQRVETGRGDARGLELLLRKRTGRLTGWVAYTLSRSLRRFEAIDGGRPFPYRFDRRHDLAITASYRLAAQWELSGTWVYASGSAVWLPVARAPAVQDFAGFRDDPFYAPTPTAFLYGPRNGSREPPYHRLDVVVQHTKQTEHRRRTLSLGVYNAYARRNPFFLYATTTEDGRMQYRRFSPLVLIPAISYGFSF